MNVRTSIDPAAQLRAAFVRFRKIIGLMSSNLVTLKEKKLILQFNICILYFFILQQLVENRKETDT